MARRLSAISVHKADAYGAFRAAAALAEYDSDAVERLNDNVMRLLIGEKSRGLTVTCIRNMRSRLAAGLRREEMQAVADGILSGLQKDFPDAEAKLLRGRRIEVWLDGLPKEVE